MRAGDAEPSPSPPVNVLWYRPTTDFGHRSQTEAGQSALGNSDAHIERIVSLILEQDQLSTSFEQRQSEVK